MFPSFHVAGSLTAVKIKKVLDLSPRFFPHNYPVAQWTVTWPTTMMRYFSSLLAMYIDLQAKVSCIG